MEETGRQGDRETRSEHVSMWAREPQAVAANFCSRRGNRTRRQGEWGGETSDFGIRKSKIGNWQLKFLRRGNRTRRQRERE